MGTFKSYSTVYFKCLFLWKRPKPETVYVCSCSVSFSGKHTWVAYIITFLHPTLLSTYKKKKNLYLSCSLIHQISPYILYFSHWENWSRRYTNSRPNCTQSVSSPTFQRSTHKRYPLAKTWIALCIFTLWSNSPFTKQKKNMCLCVCTLNWPQLKQHDRPTWINIKWLKLRGK